MSTGKWDEAAFFLKFRGNNKLCLRCTSGAPQTSTQVSIKTWQFLTKEQVVTELFQMSVNNTFNHKNTAKFYEKLHISLAVK